MEGSDMLIVHVHATVFPESVEQFKEETAEYARRTLAEPGVVRFDVVQRMEDPTRFVIAEVYQSSEAAAAHKETENYQAWRDQVEPMMAGRRSSLRYTNVFPTPEAW